MEPKFPSSILGIPIDFLMQISSCSKFNKANILIDIYLMAYVICFQRPV